MAFQRRGRGRGGGFRFAKQEEFELFPKLEELPDIVQAVTKEEEEEIVDRSERLQSYWNSSPYYIKDVDPEKDDESTEFMRWFDVDARQKTEQKGELADFMKGSAEYVPTDLAAQVSTDRRRTGKIRQRNVRWSRDSDLQKLDLFEKRERMSTEGQDEKGTSAKGKKEDGNEEEEEEDDEKVEDEEEEISDGDYNQNVDFDDDEDEFNMDDDDNDDQGTY